MKYYLIAGEASGDLHGGNLIKALKNADVNAQFRCWGGEHMQQASGNELVKHYKDTAFMGLVEVLRHLRAILKNISFCKADIAQFKPDVVILIDYPGFNLRIAKYVRKLGIKVFYYISPQVWAWHQSRVKFMKKNIDELFVILPFEPAFFSKFGWTVLYFGHPLLDEIDKEKKISDSMDTMQTLLPRWSKPVIALLPGSRRQEVTRILPLMVKMAAKFTQYQFVVAGVNSLPPQLYESVTAGSDVQVVFGHTRHLLGQATAALVASGTATLETALYNVPQVVCYRANPLSVAIARRLVKVPYISLVNLIAQKEVVTELIQQNFTETRLQKALAGILPNGAERQKMLEAYGQLRTNLGSSGVSNKVAQAMVALLKGQQP
ncbi:lipid-A-disaccharide synthase [Sphingobacteriales bacterium UPWRP_1]|nr:lipid-A-disaccharide synthase [Sphingobacteriales bacterium TSM_CSM]PSJ75460.1 lipid-A-disaccharide synthase [Sphingobacteriales bacterium UPWRP_1]